MSRRQEGQASLELIGAIPIVLLMALTTAQAMSIGHTAITTEQAARTAARVAMVTESGSRAQSAGTNALPTWLRDGAVVQIDGGRALVRTIVPDLLPGIDLNLVIERDVEMPEVQAWD